MAHATVSELRDEILAKSRDSSYTLAHIIRYLNQGLQAVSTRVQLPALIAVDGSTITTSSSANYVALPTNFQRNLYKAHSTTNNRDLKVFNSPAALDKLFTDLDLTGDLVGVAEYGAYLYYQKRSAEVVQIYYMKEPTLLTLASSQPTDIPEEHVRGLLVSYALKEIFMNRKEYDQADVYRKEFEGEIGRLEARIGPERRPSVSVDDVLNLDYLY
jgi:hypothetical protein